jgi:hypothetical protein
MPTLTAQQIKEIAEQLDCGFRSFWQKTTGELLFVPDLNNNPYADAEFYGEDLEKLDNNFGDYIEIEKPNSNDSFEIMANFTEYLNDNDKIKTDLINALNKKKPFREFKFVIDNSGVYRQQWFDFKNAQLKQWVIDKFNEATYDNRENGSS